VAGWWGERVGGNTTKKSNYTLIRFDVHIKSALILVNMKLYIKCNCKLIKLNKKKDCRDLPE
jgi:hypothetical protein